MTPPEQKEQWRDWARNTELKHVGTEINKVIDALDAAERERDFYRERAIAYQKSSDDFRARARRAEAALAAMNGSDA